jgi:hypothetical protein
MGGFGGRGRRLLILLEVARSVSRAAVYKDGENYEGAEDPPPFSQDQSGPQDYESKQKRPHAARRPYA